MQRLGVWRDHESNHSVFSSLHESKPSFLQWSFAWLVGIIGDAVIVGN